MLVPGYQPPIRQDRPARHGEGVAVYLRDGLTFKRLQLVPIDIECLAMEVRLPRRKSLAVIGCYRPPNGNGNTFLDSLDSVITSIQRNNVVVTGDFNAKHSSWYAN